MNKIKTACLAVVLTSALPLVSNVAYAEENGAGCGVGKVVMEGKSGKDAHVSAAFINMAIHAVVGPIQLFGMTSGTVGCDVTQTVSNDREKERFVASNQDSLITEIAQGNGAHLTSLASLMGVSAEDHSAFFTALQMNYDEIAVSTDVLASVHSIMQSEPRLAGYAS
ncbi:MAG: DUF3015 family protein [Thiotrichaceae bacterium]|nr:DUF3015 family protein [Thiotrichaceae bacterium]PCI10342.1 MAG: hypothetical protein COB71_12955 [Thiotrichales bacterium]